MKEMSVDNKWIVRLLVVLVIVVFIQTAILGYLAFSMSRSSLTSARMVYSESEITVQPNVATSIVTMFGRGEMYEANLAFHVTYPPFESNDTISEITYSILVYADGYSAGMWGNPSLTQSFNAVSGHSIEGEFFSSGTFTYLLIHCPIKFVHSLEIRALYSVRGAEWANHAINVSGSIYANLIEQ